MDTTIRIIGQKIKELRVQRGLTLEEVAEKSNFTQGFLSQLENNKVAPSVSSLYNIAEALGVAVTYFFPDSINPTKVIRHGHAESFHFEGSNRIYSLLSTKFSHGALSIFLITVEPEAHSLPTDEFRAHIGEEFYFVLEGVLRIYVGNEAYDLYSGDSIYFKSMARHRLENRTNQPVLLYCIITPSIF